MEMKKVNSIRTPIYRDSGFWLKDIPTMKKAFADEIDHPADPDLYIYSRYRNPTVVETEEFLANIEGASWSLLTQSGLAAIDIALSIFQNQKKNGKWLFFSEIYGGTNSFIDKVLVERRGLDVVRFTPSGESYSIDEFERIMKQHKPQVVFLETISNPMLIVADVPQIISISKKYGAKVIVDNTFATPYIFKPLDFGADIVIHSATKYLAGHGNLSAGVVTGNDKELLKKAIEYRKLVGHMISPDDAYRLLDYLKTFHLRIKQHFSNAKAVAEFLNENPLVEKVLYPSLDTHPTNGIAKSLFKNGFGAIVTFDIKGDSFEEKQIRCNTFIQKVSDSIHLIPTLGDAETILMPIEPVWGDKYPFPGMVRLSIGIEPVETLIGILDKALKH
ncbi:MAG: cystathionine gamma-synthase [Tenuifilum sp.]|jgi:cystathionine beta-lyase/cystathionine gamma-synthase|nr:cystathionine gamma-synthase [Tenuifilum sp.]